MTRLPADACCCVELRLKQLRPEPALPPAADTSHMNMQQQQVQESV
jgi:hypothetical protein